MTLNGWFKKGMTTQEYIDSMQVNREEMMGIYDRFPLPEEARPFYEGLREKGLRVIVLTADWCGDAMLCVPILMRLAEAAGFELRFLIRDENLELMDQYLTNGKSRSIPIFIFIWVYTIANVFYLTPVAIINAYDRSIGPGGGSKRGWSVLDDERHDARDDHEHAEQDHHPGEQRRRAGGIGAGGQVAHGHREGDQQDAEAHDAGAEPLAGTDGASFRLNLVVGHGGDLLCGRAHAAGAVGAMISM